MGFSLQAVDPDGDERDEYLSLSNRAMADLREAIASAERGGRAETLAKLQVNAGDRVDPAECRWLAHRLRAADRCRITAREPEPEELLGLIDRLAGFCEQCAGLGGFEVW